MYSNFRFIILTGPLSQQEFQLPLGPFSIGKNGDLWGTLDAPHDLCSLETTEKEIFLRSSDLPFWIEGEPRLPSPFAAAKPEDAPLPSQRIPLPIHKPIDLAGFGLIFFNNQDPKEGTATYPKALPKRKTTDDKRASISFPWKSYLKNAGVIGGFLFIAVSTIGYVSYLTWERFKEAQAKNSREEVAIEATKQFIKPYEQATPEHQLSFSMQSNGELIVEGKAKNSVILSKMIKKLKGFGWVVKNQVTCDDELAENVRYTLTLFGYDEAKVETTDTLGTVTIVGNIRGDKVWQQVEDLLSNMPGLTNWSVTTGSGRAIQGLLQELQAVNLNSQLDLVQKNEKILITGRLSADEERLLMQAIVVTKANLPDEKAVFIFQNIEPFSPQTNLLPASIISVGGNSAIPFIDLSNGLRLQVGSQLPSGYQIISIHLKKGIQLMKHNQIINIPIDF